VRLKTFKEKICKKQIRAGTTDCDDRKKRTRCPEMNHDRTDRVDAEESKHQRSTVPGGLSYRAYIRVSVSKHWPKSTSDYKDLYFLRLLKCQKERKVTYLFPVCRTALRKY
jgi:hypothetical protein